MSNTNDLPSNLLIASLERQLPKQTFDTWFRPLTIATSAGDAVLKFSAPNPVVKDWVVAHYAELIQQSLRDLALDHYRIEWSLNRPGTSQATAPTTTASALEGSDENGAVDKNESEQLACIGESIPSALN
jgi:chromosomal replication initiation ATPase DnaA